MDIWIVVAKALVSLVAIVTVVGGASGPGDSCDLQATYAQSSLAPARQVS